VLPGAVLSQVFSLIREQLQILDSIIVTQPVSVVDNFRQFEQSADSFLHNQDVFADISIDGSGMITEADQDITLLSRCSTFPVGRRFHLGLFSTKCAEFFGSFGRDASSFAGCVFAFAAAVFTNGSVGPKYTLAAQADTFGEHDELLICRAALRTGFFSVPEHCHISSLSVVNSELEVSYAIHS
jgi:hypothetical protein